MIIRSFLSALYPLLYFGFADLLSVDEEEPNQFDFWKGISILMIALAMSTAGLLIGIQRRLAISLVDSETIEYPERDSKGGNL